MNSLWVVKWKLDGPERKVRLAQWIENILQVMCNIFFKCSLFMKNECMKVYVQWNASFGIDYKNPELRIELKKEAHFAFSTLLIVPILKRGLRFTHYKGLLTSQTEIKLICSGFMKSRGQINHLWQDIKYIWMSLSNSYRYFLSATS